MQFPEEEYSDVVFEALGAKEALVEDRVFEGCRFVRANFGQAKFSRCRFVDCVFEHCDLSNLAVPGSVFRGVSFLDCKAVGIAWPNAAELSRPEFQRSVISFSGFGGLQLKKAVLRDCVALEADFSETDLADTNLRGTDFAGARFARTNLQRADFRGARNYLIRAGDNRLKGAKFSLPEATLLLYGLEIEIEE